MRVINFTKNRYLTFALSIVLIIAGIGGTIARGGFNLGIDFNPGVNMRVQVTGQTDVTIDKVRSTLSDLNPQIQIAGDASDQDFIIRIQDDGTVSDFASSAPAEIRELMGDAFDTIEVKQTDYVGARFSSELGTQTFTMSILALFLILVYIWIRFRLSFAVSAITALLHDVLIMLGFIGVFQMEVVTATIAAVLTIIGYSLNDTIVVFDRIRENQKLMRDSDITSVVNTSITQSLSRTLITSVTTLLAVVALFIFGTGAIRDFALALIIGILVGTYSSIFIASPVFLGWTNVAKKRKQAKDTEKYGLKAASKAEESDDEPIEATPAMEIPKAERKLKGKRKKK